jgi:hypothetical protein
MKKNTLLYLTFGLILFQSAACSPKAPASDPNELIRESVAATIAAIPTATSITPPTPYPTVTPFSLAGLFCEYQFCIGHPIDMSFFDVSAQQNPASPSTYSQGLIASFNDTLFIQVMWQTAPGVSDPQFLLDLIVDDATDTREGTMEVKLIRNMNVEFTSITSTATPVLPFGGAGAWTCGDRVFAWKAYTQNAEAAGPLFDEALGKFRCN